MSINMMLRMTHINNDRRESVVAFHQFRKLHQAHCILLHSEKDYSRVESHLPICGRAHPRKFTLGQTVQTVLRDTTKSGELHLRLYSPQLACNILNAKVHDTPIRKRLNKFGKVASVSSIKEHGSTV